MAAVVVAAFTVGLRALAALEVAVTELPRRLLVVTVQRILAVAVEALGLRLALMALAVMVVPGE